MRLVNCKCTSCGGTLQVDEENNKRYTCPFCQLVFIVEEAKNYYIQNNYYIVFVDKLKLASERKDFEILSGELVRYTGSAVNVCIPDGVKIIRAAAFSNLRALESVWIPDSCIEIGDRAFYHCESLKAITCNATGASLAQEGNNSSVAIISNTTDATFPHNIHTIGNSAFEGCRSLLRISLPYKLKNLGERAFANCFNLFEVTCEESKEHLTTSLPVIKKSTFENCGALVRVEFNHLINIEERAFYNCANLITAKIFPLVIKPFAFYNCQKLSAIDLSSIREMIGNNAFENCISLQEIELQLDTRVGTRAFMNCKGIQMLKGCRFYVEREAFYGCDSLIEVEIGELYNCLAEANSFAYTPIERLYKERREKHLCIYCGSKTKPGINGQMKMVWKCTACDRDIDFGIAGQPYGYHIVFSSLAEQTEQYRIKHKLCRYCGHVFELGGKMCSNPNCRKPKDY